MGYIIKTRIQSRKAPQMSKLASMTAEEASKYGPYGQNDRPCSVTTYGIRQDWKSRRAATFFYTVAARMCEGSERDRYLRVVWALEDGQDNVSDEHNPSPVPVNKDDDAKAKILARLKSKRDATATLMDKATADGMFGLAERFALQWTQISGEIIRLEKEIRENS